MSRKPKPIIKGDDVILQIKISKKIYDTLQELSDNLDLSIETLIKLSILNSLRKGLGEMLLETKK